MSLRARWQRPRRGNAFRRRAGGIWLSRAADVVAAIDEDALSGHEARLVSRTTPARDDASLKPRFAVVSLSPSSSSHACIHMLEGDAFGLYHHRLHPDELQHHHARKEHKHVTRREIGDQLRKKGCD